MQQYPPQGSNDPASGSQQPQYPQYPQPYPGQPQGQPYYSQQTPPPQYQQPTKNRHPVLKGCGGALASFIVIIIIIAIIVNATSGKGTATGSTPTANGTTPQATQQATTAPTNKHFAVGQSTTVGKWGATVNSVKTNPGGQYDSLKPGDTFLEVDVTVVNHTGSAQTFSSLLAFSLKDGTGQKYDQGIMTGAPASPDGSVANGDPLRGTVVFEVPGANHNFTFDFVPGFLSNDTAIWDVTI